MSFSFHFSLKTGQQQRVSSFQTSSLLTFIFQPPEQTLCLCLCPVSEELLSWLLSPDPCGRLTAEISHQHWWFDPWWAWVCCQMLEPWSHLALEDPAGCPCHWCSGACSSPVGRVWFWQWSSRTASWFCGHEGGTECTCPYHLLSPVSSGTERA